MGELLTFCAGADWKVLPGSRVNALLINVPHNGATPALIEESRRLVRESRARTVMLDSGGYQLLKAEETGKALTFDPGSPIEQNKTAFNLAPEHVVEVARKIGPDILIALDFPLGRIADPALREAEFERKVRLNAQWAAETAALRAKSCPEIGFLVPIQCYSPDHLEKVLAFLGGIDFDGFSFPVRKAKPSGIARFLVRFYRFGITRVHLLGTASFSMIILAAYMARHLFEWVSFDATTWQHTARNGRYLNPFDLSEEPLRSDVLVDGSIRNDCPCPWCADRSFTHIKNLPYPEKLSFLRCHNFWVTENFAKGIYECSQDLVTLGTFLRLRSKKTKAIDEVLRILALVDLLKDSHIRELELLLA